MSILFRVSYDGYGDDEPVVFFCLSPKKEKILYLVGDKNNTNENKIDDVLQGTLYTMDINGKNKVKIGENTKDFVPFWVSEDMVGYQELVKEKDTSNIVWFFDLKTKKETNFTELVEQAQQNKRK